MWNRLKNFFAEARKRGSDIIRWSHTKARSGRDRFWRGTKWTGSKTWAAIRWTSRKSRNGLARSWSGVKWTGKKLWTGTKVLGRWVKNFVRWLINTPSILRQKSKGFYFPDIYFNPITWNFVFRPIVSMAAGVVVVGIVKLIFWAFIGLGYLQTDLFNFTASAALAVLVALAVVRTETDENGEVTTEKVPGTDFGALVTFLGMPLPVIRTTGDYSWVGKRLLLDRIRRPLVGIKLESNNTAIEDGFIPLGDVIFPIWNSAHAETAQERSQITIPAKNRAPITGSLTLIFNFFKPRWWLKAVDSGLDIADRARQEYQEMIERLIDTDVPAVQAEMKDYLFGRPMVTAFVTKNVGSHKAGAMLRDKSGKAMLRMVPNGGSLNDAINEFRNELTNDADPAMLKAITVKTKKSDGTLKENVLVTVVQVSDPLTEVTHARGVNLKRVTFGDIILSPKVSAAAEQASAEADERIAQIVSAKTNREARKLLRPTPSELANPELYQMTTMLAAAADDKHGNIRVVMVPGGNALTQAAVAASTNLGGKNP